MAMLAEPRRRKRYNLVPRGKALYEDSTRFGTKMLEKMGWSKDKGLGANEDGAKDFVRVRYKNDAEGLGYEERDDHWTIHQDNFKELLKTLNDTHDTNGGNNNSNDIESESEAATVGFGFQTEEKLKDHKLKSALSGVSLEEKSKLSKARVHYKKFTRGKDINQYSEKDLASIFGKKEGAVAENKKETELVEPSTASNNFNGVGTINTGLTVNDYFKQKMNDFKNRFRNGETLKDQDKQVVVDGIVQDTQAVKCKKKSKKRKQADSEDEEHLLEVTEEQPKSKKHKKKAKDEATNTNERLKEAIVELSQPSEEPVALKKKKKSKKNAEIESASSEPRNEIITDHEPLIETTQLEEHSEKKKSKKNESTDLVAKRESVQVQDGDCTSVKHIKTKKNKLPIELEGESNRPSQENFLEPQTPPKEKKKKKVQEEQQPINDQVENSSDIVKKSKKNKQKSKESNNTELEPLLSHMEDTENVSVTQEAAPLPEEITKKQKKKKKNLEAELLTSAADSTGAIEAISDDKSTEGTTVKSSKKEKQMSVDSEQQQAIDADDVSSFSDDDDDDSKASGLGLLSHQELLAQLEKFNDYTISSFCAEKFRNVKMEDFPNANLATLLGYAITEDVKLHIVEGKDDEDRIMAFWTGQETKYNDTKKKMRIYYKSHLETARQTKLKQLSKSHLQLFKRRNAFSGLQT